uniref:Calmodulin-lysine N-methyltransferase n=1 Tax=Phaeomonas parva TaxID=124430 RepID=A0A7S1TZU8_9STRA
MAAAAAGGAAEGEANPSPPPSPPSSGGGGGLASIQRFLAEAHEAAEREGAHRERTFYFRRRRSGGDSDDDGDDGDDDSGADAAGAPGATVATAITVRELTRFVGGHGSVIWESGVALAQLLLLNPAISRGRRVLELGSGCGVAGLAAARCGARVVLTDNQGDVVENLRANVARNGADNTADVRALEWGSAVREGDAEAERFEVLLGADLVYNPRCAYSLALAIQAHLEEDGIFLGVSPAGRPGFLLFLHSLQRCRLRITTCPLRWRKGMGVDAKETCWDGTELEDGRPSRDVGSDTESCDSTLVAPRTPPHHGEGANEGFPEQDQDLEGFALDGEGEVEAATGAGEASDEAWRAAPAPPAPPDPCLRIPSVRMASTRGAHEMPSAATGMHKGEGKGGVVAAQETLIVFTVQHASQSPRSALELCTDDQQERRGTGVVRSKETAAGCADMLWAQQEIR